MIDKSAFFLEGVTHKTRSLPASCVWQLQRRMSPYHTSDNRSMWTGALYTRKCVVHFWPCSVIQCLRCVVVIAWGVRSHLTRRRLIKRLTSALEHMRTIHYLYIIEWYHAWYSTCLYMLCDCVMYNSVWQEGLFLQRVTSALEQLNPLR